MTAWIYDVRQREVKVDSGLTQETFQCELHPTSVWSFPACSLCPELQALLFSLLTCYQCDRSCWEDCCQGEIYAKKETLASHFRKPRPGTQVGRRSGASKPQTTTVFPGLCCSLFLSPCPAPLPAVAAGQLNFPVRLLCTDGLEAKVEGGGSELARALLSCTCRFSSRLSYTWWLVLPPGFRLSGTKVGGGGESSAAWTSGRRWEERESRAGLGAGARWYEASPNTVREVEVVRGCRAGRASAHSAARRRTS